MIHFNYTYGTGPPKRAQPPKVVFHNDAVGGKFFIEPPIFQTERTVPLFLLWVNSSNLLCGSLVAFIHQYSPCFRIFVHWNATIRQPNLITLLGQELLMKLVVGIRYLNI